MSTTKHPHQYAGKADVFPGRSSDQCTEFLEAMIAACAITAHADGKVAWAERRKLLSKLRTTSFLASYSREEVLERLLVHERSFAVDPETAYDLAAKRQADGGPVRRRALSDGCGAHDPGRRYS